MALCAEIASDYRTYWLGKINQHYCLSFRTLSICSVSMACFAMTDTIFLYESFRVQSYGSKYVIFSFKTMFYLFIIIFLNDTCQFLKIDTSIVFYIIFDFLHHFARKLYSTLKESELYNIIYRNQEFH